MGRSGAAPLRGRIARRELVMSAPAPAAEKNIFRKTNTQIGRNIFITPKNRTMRHLEHGRLHLNAAQPPRADSTGQPETELTSLTDEATPTADHKPHVVIRRQ